MIIKAFSGFFDKFHGQEPGFKMFLENSFMPPYHIYEIVIVREETEKSPEKTFSKKNFQIMRDTFR